MLSRNILLIFDWKRANAYTGDSGGLYIDPKVIDFKKILKDIKKFLRMHHSVWTNAWCLLTLES